MGTEDEKTEDTSQTEQIAERSDSVLEEAAAAAPDSEAQAVVPDQGETGLSAASEEQVDALPESSQELAPSEVAAASAAEGGEGEAPPKKPVDPRMKWYVVNAYSGYELKAVKALQDRIRTMGFEDSFGEIQVPQETVVELVRGQKKTSSRKFFPGYILVQMILDENTWHLVKETPKISGFVGDKTAPLPLDQVEVERILGQVQEGSTSPRSRMKFEQGETVKVVDGPFADFNGTVEEVKPEKGKVRVLISIFGRATPVEFDFVQVEKC
jgi:transcription termination/antitermination protein NusG